MQEQGTAQTSRKRVFWGRVSDSPDPLCHATQGQKGVKLLSAAAAGPELRLLTCSVEASPDDGLGPALACTFDLCKAC
jgi:hypothetical protein